MARPLIVADVGNSAIDIGEFQLSDDSAEKVPRPTRVAKFLLGDFDFDRLANWLSNAAPRTWYVGSVNEPARRQLVDWLRDCQHAEQIHTMRYSNLEMPTSVLEPHAVGIDRLAAAMAANRLRNPNRPAIVIDMGSAIKIDVVSAAGIFLGGSIAPGLQMSLRALAKDTDLLPAVDEVQKTPSLVGDNTIRAIEAGVYWMATSGIDGMVARLQNELANECDLFGTGGSLTSMLQHINHEIEYQPHLVLSGLAMANP